MPPVPNPSFRPLRAAAALLLCAGLAVPLSGCVETAMTAGAVGGSAAMEERGIKGAANDTVIRARINALWSSADERMWRKVNLQVYNGRVLLSGVMDTNEMRDEAVRLAWQAEGVKEVINEIQLAESTGVDGFARDTWIATELKSKLLFDSKISSVNYSVEVSAGSVYLIGLAQSQDELDRVINHARSLEYVKRVISYVRVKPQETASQAPAR